jgi:hypothetical protein
MAHAGVGIAVVIWASAAFTGWKSIRKLIDRGHTAYVAAGREIVWTGLNRLRSLYVS